MGYAIVCDARKRYDLGIEVLALVDRAKTKKTWWTSDNANLILHYRKESAAQFTCRRLRKNNARVVPYGEAIGMIEEQAQDIERAENMDTDEQGWDAHKMWR